MLERYAQAMGVARLTNSILRAAAVSRITMERIATLPARTPVCLGVHAMWTSGGGSAYIIVSLIQQLANVLRVYLEVIADIHAQGKIRPMENISNLHVLIVEHVIYLNPSK
jgi:hypothetical protein